MPLDCPPPPRERVQKFTVTLKSIMKVYYETVAWLACARAFSSSGTERERDEYVREREKEREEEGSAPARETEEGWLALVGSAVCCPVTEFIASSLSMPRNRESSRSRPSGRTRLAFSSKAAGEMAGGNRAPGPWPQGDSKFVIDKPSRSRVFRSDPATTACTRSAFRNGTHCCTLYPPLHKPGTPDCGNSRTILGTRLKSPSPVVPQRFSTTGNHGTRGAR